MADLRLFAAVALPAAALELVAAVQRDWQRAGADAKWTRRENLHLTLKFFGDTPEEDLSDLAALLDEAAVAVPPHVARVKDVGAFPDLRRIRVLWVGLDEPSGQLARLQQRIDEATAVVAPPDPRGFTAHLTLGRCEGGRNTARLAELIQGYRLRSTPEVPVNEIVLMRSELSRAGPTYTPLHRSPLVGR